MGRFYKTASPQYLDYMYELPQEEIMKAVQTADAGITANTQTNEGLKSLLKLQALKPDQADANRILTGYDSQIESLAKEIQQNPLQYRRKNSQIGDLRRTIERDFTTGDASMIQGNFTTRTSNYEAMKEDYKKSPDKYNYQDLEKLQNQLDTNYSGYKQGAYNVDRLREFADINDFDKYGKDYEAEITERLGAFKGNDGMLYTSKDYTKQVDPNLIRKNMVDVLLKDKKLNDYYGQQIQLGNISQENYIKQLAGTADRIAEKFGFKETSKGLTSIKNDDVATAEAAYLLANAETNATPDVIADSNIVDKYSNGVPDANTVAGTSQAINVVSGKVQETKQLATTLAKENNITIPAEYAQEIQKGNFSVLKNLKGKNGEKISNQEIYQLQVQHNDLAYDRELMRNKIRVASVQKNPDEYMAKTKDSNIEVIGDFQKYGIVSKADNIQFTKAVKATQTELAESQGYYDAPLQFSQQSLEKLPANIKAKFKDGMTINGLVAAGLARVKMNTETYKVQVPMLDASGKTIKGADGKPLTKTVEQTRRSSGNDFENMKINAKNAKPTMTPDGNGRSLWQFEVVIDGHPVTSYIDEKNLVNRGLERFMNRDAMKAAYQYRKAESEGVIDEEGINISGITFKKVNGTTRAFTSQGSVPVDDAVQYIGNYYKAQREKLLR